VGFFFNFLHFLRFMLMAPHHPKSSPSLVVITKFEYWYAVGPFEMKVWKKN